MFSGSKLARVRDSEWRNVQANYNKFGSDNIIISDKVVRKNYVTVGDKIKWRRTNMKILEM